MSAISSELAPNERGLVALLRNSLSRDEFFAGLFILGCANGFMGRMLYALSLQGWPVFVTGLEMNLIVLFAFYAGVSARTFRAQAQVAIERYYWSDVLISDPDQPACLPVELGRDDWAEPLHFCLRTVLLIVSGAHSSC